MSDNINEKYAEFNNQLIRKHWINFLSAVEKELLQSFRSDNVSAYELTSEEKMAKMYINSIMIDGKALSLIRR